MNEFLKSVRKLEHYTLFNKMPQSYRNQILEFSKIYACNRQPEVPAWYPDNPNAIEDFLTALIQIVEE